MSEYRESGCPLPNAAPLRPALQTPKRDFPLEAH